MGGLYTRRAVKTSMRFQGECYGLRERQANFARRWLFSAAPSGAEREGMLATHQNRMTSALRLMST